MIWRPLRRFQAYLKPNRRVIYDRDDLDAWLDGKRRRSTSDHGDAA